MNTQQICVELLDEGTIVYRPVSATHIKDMTFTIEGIIPETETWAFSPGEIVECKYHKFIHGNEEITAFRARTPDEIANLQKRHQHDTPLEEIASGRRTPPSQ
jgi:hypothetical protein